MSGMRPRNNSVGVPAQGRRCRTSQMQHCAAACGDVGRARRPARRVPTTRTRPGATADASRLRWVAGRSDRSGTETPPGRATPGVKARSGQVRTSTISQKTLKGSPEGGCPLFAVPRLQAVTYFRVSQAVALLGVSDDTVRRYISLGRLPVRRDEADRRVIDGVALAAFARETMTSAPDPSPVASSARNRLVGRGDRCAG